MFLGGQDPDPWCHHRQRWCSGPCGVCPVVKLHVLLVNPHLGTYKVYVSIVCLIENYKPNPLPSPQDDATTLNVLYV